MHKLSSVSVNGSVTVIYNCENTISIPEVWTMKLPIRWGYYMGWGGGGGVVSGGEGGEG